MGSHPVYRGGVEQVGGVLEGEEELSLDLGGGEGEIEISPPLRQVMRLQDQSAKIEAAAIGSQREGAQPGRRPARRGLQDEEDLKQRRAARGPREPQPLRQYWKGEALVIQRSRHGLPDARQVLGPRRIS